jgi:hypothetical protein
MVYAEWNATTYYITGDIVQYLAGVYEALSTNINQIPPSFPAIWNQIGGSGGVNAITAGTGISVNPVPPINPTVSINLASADARLTITNGVGTQRILNNQCPISVGAGPALTASGTNPTGITIDMPNVGVAGTSAFPTSITTDAKGRVSAITAGSAPVASVNAGTAITITGPPTAPVVNNAGLVGLTAANQGTNITIGGTPTNPIINATGTPSALTSYSGWAGSPNQLTPAISGTYGLPGSGWNSIINGNTGYAPITTTENLWIEIYIDSPIASVSYTFTCGMSIVYWNGSSWVQHPSANTAFYNATQGGSSAISGGNVANTLDCWLRSYVPSVAGQVRFSVGISNVYDPNSVQISFNPTNIQYQAVPITNPN